MHEKLTRQGPETQASCLPPSLRPSDPRTSQARASVATEATDNQGHEWNGELPAPASRVEAPGVSLPADIASGLTGLSASVPDPSASAVAQGEGMPPRSTAASHSTPSLEAGSTIQAACAVRPGSTEGAEGVPGLSNAHSLTTTDLPTAWVLFLNRWPWDLFGSHTFREDVHPEAAFKMFRLFISMLNRKLYGPRWHKHGQGITWVCAMERQGRGVVHFHSLLKSPELVKLLRSSWRPAEGRPGRWENEVNELWNALAGFARIEPIDSSAAVRGYVSKYVLKGGEIELGGPGMPEFKWQGHPSRVDRLWLTTEVGRATARGILDAVTTPEERGKLLARFETRTRRATADLLADVRERALAFKAGYRKPAA